MSKIFKVLVCGGIGVGKSTACKLFGELGIPVYYSDKESAKIMNSNPDVVRKIKDAFGESLYSSGNLDRKALGEIVFNDKGKLNRRIDNLGIELDQKFIKRRGVGNQRIDAGLVQRAEHEFKQPRLVATGDQPRQIFALDPQVEAQRPRQARRGFERRGQMDKPGPGLRRAHHRRRAPLLMRAPRRRDE